MIGSKRMPKHKRQGMKTKRMSSEISGGGVHPLLVIVVVMVVGFIYLIS